MGKMMNKAKEMAGKSDKQIDEAMQKAGEQIDKRTKGKYSEQINKAVQRGQGMTGPGGQAR